MSTGNAPFSDWLLATECGVTMRCCEAVDTPRSLAVWLLVKGREWAQLISLPAPDRDPLVNRTFSDDYLVTEMLRKNPRLTIVDKAGRPLDRKRVAMRSWVESERRCRSVNESIMLSELDERLQRVIQRTQWNIARTLRPLTTQTITDVLDASRHGPGATSTVRGSNVTPANKMITPLGVTPLLRKLREWVTPLFHDETVGFIEETHDTWINVPKSATTDRGISINPGMNVFLQLGVGAILRQRLKDSGLDIKQGQKRHRQLALSAQRLGLATIDLSAASDSISREVVRLLFPKRWFHLLEMLRTFHTRIHGITVGTAKFAAMGNGYTFELETLIFWALARSVHELLVEDGIADVREAGSISVYGDDIIVPRDISGELIEVLGQLGFSTNIKKTFLAGAFFESCGCDAYNGQDIRPMYLDAEPRDKTEAVILIANSIRLYAARRAYGLGCDQRFLKAWLYAVGRDEKAKRTGVPLSWAQAPDDLQRDTSVPSAASGLIRNFDEFSPELDRGVGLSGPYRHDYYLDRDRGWHLWRARMYYFAPINYKSTNDLYHVGCYIVALHGGTPERTRAVEPVRGSNRPGRLKSMSVLHWTDIGPWVDLHG